MKNHFVFDFDDTISSSYEHNQNLFYETFLPYCPDIDETVVRRIHRENRGPSLNFLFALVIDELKLKNLDADKLTEENEQLHVKKYKKMTLFNGVEKLFEILKNKDKEISICTNRQYDSLNAMIDHRGLRKYLDNIISCKDEGFEKPDPTCLIKLVEDSRKDKSEFIYFGDSKTDFEFATNAGMDFVIVDQYLNGKNFYDMIIKAFL